MWQKWEETAEMEKKRSCHQDRRNLKRLEIKRAQDALRAQWKEAKKNGKQP